MTPEVAQAVQEIRATFSDNRVEYEDDGVGGAYVRVLDLDIGEGFVPRKCWLGVHLTHMYPAADVYPQFTNAGLERVGRPLGPALSATNWQNRPATQISRKSTAWRVGIDSAATKIHQVLQWLKSS
jgi:hypothetical protein